MAESDDSERTFEPESKRKLFLGGLNYNTTEDGLTTHFQQYGEIVDVIVMKFPDSKRSRGFGFVTFSKVEETENCYADCPHTIDGTEIETKRAKAATGGRYIPEFTVKYFFSHPLFLALVLFTCVLVPFLIVIGICIPQYQKRQQRRRHM